MNCQLLKDILRYHRIVCYALYTSTTRNDQTSVECLLGLLKKYVTYRIWLWSAYLRVVTYRIWLWSVYLCVVTYRIWLWSAYLCVVTYRIWLWSAYLRVVTYRIWLWSAYLRVVQVLAGLHLAAWCSANLPTLRGVVLPPTPAHTNTHLYRNRNRNMNQVKSTRLMCLLLYDSDFSVLVYL